MATGVHSWSTTAASNATSDSNVGWAEGMSPSAVNDSSRAEMASVAKFYADINGSITTGGTSTAFTITSNQSFASVSAMDNAIIAFIPNATSGAAPTLAVDGLTAKKIRMVTGVDLPDGVLIAGTPYVVTYENGVGEFLLHNFAGNPWLIPLGACVPFFGATSPNSSLVLPYGQAINRTTYSTLFTMFSTTYGVGDGSTTFNIPDLRGRVVAGKDDMGGSDSGRLSSTYFGASSGQSGATLGHTGGAESHTLTAAQAPANMAGTGTGAGSGSIGASNFALFSGTNALASGGNTINNVVDAGTNALSITVTSLTVNVNASGGSAHPIVQPTIIGNWLMRVI